MTLEQIIQKLELGSKEINNVYLINNVRVGLVWALKNKEIKKDKSKYAQLKKLHETVSKIKMPYSYEHINQSNQSIAGFAALDALRIIMD